MLTPDTKRHIDNARQVLVGKVPDPKSQIEQITNALVYKFMDDMDNSSADLGGKRRYFVGDYEKYGWRLLMNDSLGAHDRLTLYRTVLESMAKNPNLPPLFQSIFRNAYLPFNDARTLTLFLKEVNYFSYDNSEELGNGYEYLLSIMGSQGDAGQFRTPRHIIDFIVAAVNPTKNDSVLDPACGTAGFLISAYKHVMAQHDGIDDISGVFEQNEIPLTADERHKIYNNYHGFDIDDNMVKMAKVNMYLHSFPDPKIVVHDSLSSEDYWNERYDVILANPPFMSPKGGIEPHKKFGIQASRAEVLFVDYIASHLKPAGRAGIIVPEGIIFQSGKAYKELRKNLVENYLYAVVSLPAGVFQPYSGVKTSILLLDKELASKRNEILFIKIENDGLSLGAQRRPIAGNQLPTGLEIIKYFQEDGVAQSDLALPVLREKIVESGDYNLSGELYKVAEIHEHKEWPMAKLQDLALLIQRGKTPKYGDSDIQVIKSGQARGYYSFDFSEQYFVEKNFSLDHRQLQLSDLLINSTGVGTAGRVTLFNLRGDYLVDGHITIVRLDQEKVIPEYALYCLAEGYGFKKIEAMAQGNGGQIELSLSTINNLRIPFPPIEVQREIVAELATYQKITDAAQTIIKAYKPGIKINSAWPKISLDKIAYINRSTAEPIKIFGEDTDFVYIDVSSVGNGSGKIDLTNVIKVDGAPSRARRVVKESDVLLSTVRPNLKAFAYIDELPRRVLASTGFAVLTAKDNILPKFLYYSVCLDIYVDQLVSRMGKGSYPSINSGDLKQTLIALPPLDEQQQIVTELELEEQLVDANKKLIKLYTKKIKSKNAEVWGE